MSAIACDPDYLRCDGEMPCDFFPYEWDPFDKAYQEVTAEVEACEECGRRATLEDVRRAEAAYWERM